MNPKHSVTTFFRSPQKWVNILIIILLLLGIFFRFVNLDKKVYWGDESSTSLRISGYTSAEVQQALQGHIVGIEDILKYQHPNPDKKLIDTVRSLAVEDAHPPLYFVMVRVWMEWFGDSMAVTRSFSAAMSLLIFPCIYWLCLELFESSLVGWMTIALIAVSPFHVLYAQEARMYSLWTVLILLSSTVLLRAMRIGTKLNWVIYALTVALGLYSYLFTIFVVIGHGIYVLIIERCRLSRTFIYYLLASLTGVIIFSPWILVIIANKSSVEQAISWATETMSLSFLVTHWIYNLSYVFMDFWYVFTYNPEAHFNWHFGKYLIPLILILVGYSLYLLYRKAPEQTSVFVLTLIGSTGLAVLLHDLITGGYLSIMGRYFIPCYIGIELAVAHLLARQISSISVNIWQQRMWKFVTVLLLSGGVLSCIISSQNETWWNKRTTSDDELHAIHIINQATQPLLIAESAPLTLSHKLNRNVKILVENPSSIIDIPHSFTHLFLWQPSQELGSKLEKEQNYKITMAYKGRKQNLWQLEKE